MVFLLSQTALDDALKIRKFRDRLQGEEHPLKRTGHILLIKSVAPLRDLEAIGSQGLEQALNAHQVKLA
jgi:hypothetical protein